MRNLLKLSALALSIAFLPSISHASDSDQEVEVVEITSPTVGILIQRIRSENPNSRSNVVVANERMALNLTCLDDTLDVIDNTNNDPNYFPSDAKLKNFLITHLAVENIARDPNTFLQPVPFGQYKADSTEKVCDMNSNCTPYPTNMRYDAQNYTLIGFVGGMTRGGYKVTREASVSIIDIHNTFDVLAYTTK